MDDSQTYLTSTICRIAGCKQATFHKWRSRNGLLAPPKTADVRDLAWNRWTVLDICILRTVVVLVVHGLRADEAVWIADGSAGLRVLISSILERRNQIDELVGVRTNYLTEPCRRVMYQGAVIEEFPARCSRLDMQFFDSDAGVAAEFLRPNYDVNTVINLKSIVRYVTKELNEMASVS
jgi:hypothetical protein